MLNMLIEKMFSRPTETETINYLNNCLTPVARKCHEMKLGLMTKVLNVLAQRIGVVKNVFNEISSFVESKGGMKPNGRREPQF
jgi:hypothetical protein